MMEKQEIEIDKAQAQQFIKFLTGNDQNPVHWQWFDDQKKGRVIPDNAFGTLSEMWDNLGELNERGAGIFVTVNQTDGISRKANNIESIRCVFIDLDGAALDPLKDAQIKFNLLVETSPGRYHAYFRIKDLPVSDANREEIFDLFASVQKALAGRFAGDPSVTDISRVMRCPGFIHQKKDPFLSRIIAANPASPVDISEIIEKFKIDTVDPEVKAPTA
jgi:hypothetical protein